MGEDQYAKRKQGWACSALSCGRPSRRLSDRAPNGIAAGRRVGRLSRSSGSSEVTEATSPLVTGGSITARWPSPYGRDARDAIPSVAHACFELLARG
jgi:hypothetical protein